jgi:phage baseplate assembly protein W
VIAVVCDWGGDLSVGPGGDIGVAPVEIEIQQRLTRRLLTTPGEYIWHTEYGAGLGTFVGEPCSPGLIESTILNQLQHEALVAMNPSPTVQTDQSLAGSISTTSVTIQYQVSGTAVGMSVVLPLGS